MHILKMLESGVLEHLFALKEPSDCKEALPIKDVWKSAITMSGAQSVMTFGALLMLEWPVDNWDSLPPVRLIRKTFNCLVVTLCNSIMLNGVSCYATYQPSTVEPQYDNHSLIHALLLN